MNAKMMTTEKLVQRLEDIEIKVKCLCAVYHISWDEGLTWEFWGYEEGFRKKAMKALGL